MKYPALCVLAAAIAFGVSDARAVLVDGGDGTQNTTSPGGLIPWNNVGSVNGFSGVYLGNGWMITAAHVGAGTTTFAGIGTFTVQSGTATRLRNADSTYTDMVMYRLSTIPSPTLLPSLTIASTTPAAGSTVYMIGNGRNRATGLTSWYVDTTTTPYTWTVKTGGGRPADATGYLYGTGSSKRWGENTIESGIVDVNAGFGIVHSLWTNFTDTAGTVEAQVVDNDSGGGMFLSDGTFVGLLDARGLYTDQPTDSAVFGNTSYAANIADAGYRAQIVSLVPEPSMAIMAVVMMVPTLARRRRAL